MMWFCKDHEDLTIQKFKKLGLISEDEIQKIRNIMHIENYSSFDYHVCFWKHGYCIEGNHP